MTWTGTWMMHVEEGQGQPRRHPSVVSPAGCGGLQLGPRRDHDDQDGAHGRRSWKDALLGRAHSRKEHKTGSSSTAPTRQRSRTPVGRRQHKGGRREHRSNGSNLKAMPPLPLLTGQGSTDTGIAAPPPPAGPASPVFAFFATADSVPPPPPPPLAIDTGNNQQEIDQVIADALAAPLEFSSEPIAVAYRAPPSSASSVVHIGAMT
nr:basic helix-loop-helix transcription factor scleraxis-like [Aegilops tauschii subsp. strangulata]